MKFLKFLLVIFLILIFLGIGGIFFQNQIISHMTKTKNSEFTSIKYSIANNEISFNDFIVNGKHLGKGKAKISITKAGIFGLVPKIKLQEMRLEDVDLNVIYNMPNSIIDGFIEKIDAPLNNEKIEKTTEQYVNESVKEIENVNLDIDNFITNKIKTNIETTNKLKTDYNNLKDLKGRAQKLKELNNEIKPLAKLINEESSKAEQVVSKVELERNMMLDNISEDLTKLDNMVSLNNLENINSYIFLDRGKDIVIPTNKSLKIIALINEIKNLNIPISDIAINGEKFKFSNLDKEMKDITGKLSLDENIEVNIKGEKESYILNYIKDDIKVVATSSLNSVINTVITYKKSDLLDGKVIDLVSELNFKKNELKTINKTVLTEEEKILLTEKINNLETTKYNEMMNKYLEQTNVIDELIEKTYEQIEKLNKLQRNLLLLNVIIPIEENLKIENDSEVSSNSKNSIGDDTISKNNDSEAKTNIQNIVNQILDKKK